MNHSAEIKALKRRIDELETRLAGPEAEPKPKVKVYRDIETGHQIAPAPYDPPFEQQFPGKLKLDPFTGDILVPHKAIERDTYEERMTAQREQAKRDDEERRAKATEGLPPGIWRDPTGQLRKPDGTVYHEVREADYTADYDAVMTEMREEHRARIGQLVDTKIAQRRAAEAEAPEGQGEGV